MNIRKLRVALHRVKMSLEYAIRTATFRKKGKLELKDYTKKDHGGEAKTSFIRGQRMITPIHAVVKESLSEQLSQSQKNFDVYPPLGDTSPELKFTGLIKRKDQDVTVLFDDKPEPEKIKSGPLAGFEEDPVGKDTSEQSLVVNLRSQISGVNKNFDTMIERLIAEPLNLRLRLPDLVMGEVYMIPSHGYSHEKAKEDKVRFENRSVNVERFIRTFESISGRKSTGYSGVNDYKYERSALVIADFDQKPPKVYLTLKELKRDGLVSKDFEADFEALSPNNFVADLLDIHRRRHEVGK